MSDVLRKLARLDIGHCMFNVPLREHSRWRIGGSADLLVEPSSVEQVQNLRRAFCDYEIPYVTIGDGSNILFDDEGVRGVVLKIGRRMSRFSISGEYVNSEAGVFVPSLVHSMGNAGLSGLEHAIGIPGTLGGLILMNGGSQRKGVGDCVERIWAVDERGKLIEIDRSTCCFSYRSSSLQQENLTIVRARLRCPSGVSRDIRREMLNIMRTRRRKFPHKQPNCGSVFLSDPAMYKTVGPPGKVIEDLGFKGMRIGDAMIPHTHANFIVNLGRARSSDVLALIQHVRQTVFQRSGFMLTCEVRYIAPEGRMVPAHNALERKN